MTNESPKALESSEQVAAEISSLRREIDILKTLAKKPEKPFYRNGSLMLAAAAFLFTLITYQRQDQNDTQVKLRNVLKDLYSLPEQDADARLKFKGREEAQISIGLNHQYHVLSLQAYALAEHLGSHLDIPERLAVADAIIGIQPRLAEKMLTNVTIPPDDIEDMLAARRLLGTVQIVSGRTKLGEENFQVAIDSLKSTELHLDDQYQVMSNALTELRWAESYLIARNCLSAQTHLQTAQDEIKQLAGTQGAEMMTAQLDFDVQAQARCLGSSANQ